MRQQLSVALPQWSNRCLGARPEDLESQKIAARSRGDHASCPCCIRHWHEAPSEVAQSQQIDAASVHCGADAPGRLTQSSRCHLKWCVALARKEPTFRSTDVVTIPSGKRMSGSTSTRRGDTCSSGSKATSTSPRRGPEVTQSFHSGSCVSQLERFPGFLRRTHAITWRN